MRSEILTMGIVISLAGIIIALSKSFQIGTETVYPYALVGAIILLIGFVTCVIALAVPAKEVITLAVATKEKEEIFREGKTPLEKKHPRRPKVAEEIYSPIFYIAGHPDYKNRTLGSILLKPESIAFKTGLGSLYQMDLEIPIKQIIEIDVKKTKYLVLSYEDSVGLQRDLVFEPNGDAKRKMYHLVSQMKHLIRKKAIGKEIEDPLKILQIRYAKGEITKEQYKEMKKTLES